MDGNLAHTRIGLTLDLAHVFAMASGKQCAAEERECEGSEEFEGRNRQHHRTPKMDGVGTRRY
jgi:hypothetical protein